MKKTWEIIENGLKLTLKKGDGCFYAAIEKCDTGWKIMNDFTCGYKGTKNQAFEQFRDIVRMMEQLTCEFIKNWSIEQLKTIHRLFQVFEPTSTTNLPLIIAQKHNNYTMFDLLPNRQNSFFFEIEKQGEAWKLSVYAPHEPSHSERFTTEGKIASFIADAVYGFETEYQKAVSLRWFIKYGKIEALRMQEQQPIPLAPMDLSSMEAAQ